MRQSQLFLSFLLLTDVLFGQSPATPHAWLSTGKVSARIAPTGIHADNVGGFILHSDMPGGSPIKLLSHLTPWVGGMDPAENIKTACETNDPLNSDWQGGFWDKPNSEKVWKVTSDQIATHKADFEDNGVINNPILEVFAWPAYLNGHSILLNGFDLKGISYENTAPYFDQNGNGVYDPEKGDYPMVNLQLFQGWFSINSIVFTPFHDNKEGNLSQSSEAAPLLEGYLLAFTFDCIEHDFVKNSIFFQYGGFRNAGVEPLRSLYLGVYADFSIGNPNDDYLGCTPMPYHEKVFCYNSDTLYDTNIGANPPMISLMSFNGINDNLGVSRRLQYFSPVYLNTTFPNNTLMPTGRHEFHRRITGAWRDGSPMTIGGLGNIGDTPTEFAFPDHPADPNGWSELAANNPKGNRSCVISYGPTAIHPTSSGTNFTFALTVSDKIGLTKQLKHLSDMRTSLRYIFEWSWDLPSPLDTIDCQNPLETTEVLSPESISLSPNPANKYFTLRSAQSSIREVIMFDFLGKQVLNKKYLPTESNEVMLETNTLPPGLYTLQWLLEDGRRGAGKVVVAR